MNNFSIVIDGFFLALFICSLRVRYIFVTWLLWLPPVFVWCTRPVCRWRNPQKTSERDTTGALRLLRWEFAKRQNKTPRPCFAQKKKHNLSWPFKTCTDAISYSFLNAVKYQKCSIPWCGMVKRQIQRVQWKNKMPKYSWETTTRYSLRHFGIHTTMQHVHH